MVDELRSNPKIKDVEFSLNPPAMPEQLKVAQDIFKLTPEMIEFYSESNGFKLTWQPVDSKKYSYGTINIFPIEWSFSDCRDYFDEGKYYIFDYFLDDDSGFTVFKIDNEKDPIIYLCRDEASSIGVNFSGYLDLLLESRGYCWWQSSIVSPGKSIEALAYEKNKLELF